MPRARGGLHLRGTSQDSRRNTRANTRIDQRYDAAPTQVPRGFVIRSEVPESRFGRNACRISMVRLNGEARQDREEHRPLCGTCCREIGLEANTEGNESDDVLEGCAPIASGHAELVPKRARGRLCRSLDISPGFRDRRRRRRGPKQCFHCARRTGTGRGCFGLPAIGRAGFMVSDSMLGIWIKPKSCGTTLPGTNKAGRNLSAEDFNGRFVLDRPRVVLHQIGGVETTA